MEDQVSIKGKKARERYAREAKWVREKSDAASCGEDTKQNRAILHPKAGPFCNRGNCDHQHPFTFLSRLAPFVGFARCNLDGNSVPHGSGFELKTQAR
jgi:hypothetical protein